LSINSCISLIFILARFKTSTEDKIFVRDFCNGISCSCSLSYPVKQQSMSTGANGNTPSCELFAIHLLVNYFVLKWTKHRVLCVEYPLYRGGKYNFPRFCNVNWDFIDPHNTVNFSSRSNIQPFIAQV
jgi:hypothetical protein